MAFPTLVPSSRKYDPGDWPVTTYKAADGAEVRIRRGDRRTGATLQLTYKGLADADVDLFLQHYNEQQGTFKSFAMTSGAKGGYAGSQMQAGDYNQWRYDKPVQVTNIYPGVSNVAVSLVAVLTGV